MKESESSRETSRNNSDHHEQGSILYVLSKSENSGCQAAHDNRED